MPGRVLKVVFFAVVVLVVCAGIASADRGQVLNAMKIDATALTSKAFFLENQWYEGTGIETVELAAGTYYLAPGSGLVMRCSLIVTDAGTWQYASECDPFLAGRGTDTLRLIGHTVSVDASPLSTPISIANLDSGQFGASARPVTLLPTFADYFVSPGPGVIAGCSFGVALDGTISYPDEVHGCLAGRGTRAVTFHGVPVNVDARALSTREFSILQADSLMHQPSDVVQRYRLLPTLSGYQYGAWTVSGILWPSLGLTIGLDGRIGYPALADGWLSGRGSDTLVVRGYTVQIDARNPAPGHFAVPDGGTGWLDRVTVHTLTLAPVSYLYFTGEPTDFRFSIREADGTIEVAPDVACGRGQGATLIVACRMPTGTDTTPPDTVITAGPAEGTSVEAPPTFEFSATEAGSGFQCRILRVTEVVPDFRACASPHALDLNPLTEPEDVGFEVRAIDASGNVDPTPATRTFGYRPPRAGAYGNLRIRGIDVFQVVQPNSGAQQYGFEPAAAFPSYRGGGTPTDFLGFRPIDDNNQMVSYDGVALDPDKSTTAVVYLDVEGAPAADADQPLHVTVRTRTGSFVSGTTTIERRRPEVSRTRWVRAAERDDRAFGVQVWLGRPTSMTPTSARGFDVEAEVRFAPGTTRWDTRECDGRDCSADNRFTLRGVRVASGYGDLRMASLELHRDGQRLRSPGEVLDRPRDLLPNLLGTSPGWYRERINITRATNLLAANPGHPSCATNPAGRLCAGDPECSGITVRRCRSAQVSRLVDDWSTRNPARRVAGNRVFRDYDVVLGISDYDGEPGWASGPKNPTSTDPGPSRDVTQVSRTTPTGPAPRIVVNANARPISAVAHEFAHLMTAPHADMSCGGNADGPTGGGNWSEAWPGDNQGLLQGTKFDSQRGWDPVSRAVEPVVAGPGFATLYDLMSYCGALSDTVTTPSALPNDGDKWVSAYLWNRLTRRFIELGQRVPRGQTIFPLSSAATASLKAGIAGSDQAFASGAVTAGGGRIARVVPADGDSSPPGPVPGAPVRLRALDRDGRVLEEVGVSLDVNTHDTEGVATFVGRVPSGAAAVELVRDGAVLDRLDRSRPPRVRLLAPSRRTRSRAGRDLVVRWSAEDPDGAREEPQVSVDYSADNGRRWRTVYLGPDTGRAIVPGRYLERSRSARIRIGVNDGFNETRVVSARFRADGAPPLLRIIAPDENEPLTAGAPVLLLGEAHDDAGDRLKGRGLTWFAGRRRLGSGERLSARLPAGSTSLRLVARDRSGRRAVATRKLRVPAHRLRLLRLEAPATVRRGARRVAVRVGASAPATLRTGGRRYHVSSRPRRVVLRLPRRPARGAIRIRFTLVPRGGAIGRVRGHVEVFRG